jgi:chromosome segregation ATPase
MAESRGESPVVGTFPTGEPNDDGLSPGAARALLATLPDVLLLLADVRQQGDSARTELLAAEATASSAVVEAVRLRSELDTTVAALVATEARARALQDELAQVASALVIADERAAVAGERAASSAAQAQADEERARVGEERARIAEERARIAEADARAAWGRVEAADAEVQAVRSTRSWRMTEPLRLLGAGARRVRRGLRSSAER